MADNTLGGQGRENNGKQSGLSWSQPASSKPGNISSTTSAPKSSPLLKPATPLRERTITTNGGGRKLALFFISGVVVGGLLSWSWFSLAPATPVAENGEEVATETGTNAVGSTGGTTGTPTLPGTVVGSESLVVPSTQTAGRSVVVSSATVSSPTWVVVYDSNNGTRGNALGAALFFPEGSDKTINLLRGTVAGKTYLVGRHTDNGDKQFSMTLDKPVVNAAGNPVYVEFTAR